MSTGLDGKPESDYPAFDELALSIHMELEHFFYGARTPIAKLGNKRIDESLWRPLKKRLNRLARRVHAIEQESMSTDRYGSLQKELEALVDECLEMSLLLEVTYLPTLSELESELREKLAKLEVLSLMSDVFKSETPND